MAIITLKDMKFHAYHGCLDFEKENGNTFLVSVKMELDTYMAGITDNIDDTLNYQEVYDVVKYEMAIPSNLIEHIGQRILDALIKQFPEIKSLKIQLVKLNPPLGGKVENVSIELESHK
ncbi:MAG: dihydroneopterin aldolase [Paludibacteraceae bacterium]